MMIGTILLPIGILIAGWSAETKQPWIAVDIVSSFYASDSKLTISQGFFIFGMGTVLTSQCVTMYVVDTFTLHAASGTLSASLILSAY